MLITSRLGLFRTKKGILSSAVYAMVCRISPILELKIMIVAIDQEVHVVARSAALLLLVLQ